MAVLPAGQRPGARRARGIRAIREHLCLAHGSVGAGHPLPRPFLEGGAPISAFSPFLAAPRRLVAEETARRNYEVSGRCERAYRRLCSSLAESRLSYPPRRNCCAAGRIMILNGRCLWLSDQRRECLRRLSGNLARTKSVASAKITEPATITLTMTASKGVQERCWDIIGQGVIAM